VLWRSQSRWFLRSALPSVLGLCCGAQAQLALGDLHTTANGQLATLYNSNFGNFETDEHSLGLAGRGTISGDYYNPNFLSFSVLPYYGRSQDNSDSQSISDASGYNGNIDIFKGSHFPGFVNFNQTWNNSGTFGIPGVAGLTTTNNGHAENVGWSILLPDLPTLSFMFGDTSGTSSLLGSDTSTESTTRNFNLGSTYALAGFFLNGSFIHLNTDTGINGLENGESETTTGSSNQYRLTAQRPVPYNNSNLSMGFTRSSYHMDDSLGGENDGTTDTANANLNLRFPKVPVTLTAIYTDNLLGSFEEQLVSNGQAPLVSIASPESHSLSLEASAFYNVLPRLVVGGYVDRTEQYFAGQTEGLTQLGVNVNYSFLLKFKGLMFNAGFVDSASQQGNTRIGFIGNASYNRYFGKWEINTFVLYNQDMQTLFVNYTTSTLNYGGALKRQVSQNLRWIGVAHLVHSMFEQTEGNTSHGESFSTMLIWRRASVSGTYTQSSGTSILTANGLVTTPIPAQLISPGNSILFNGKSYGSSVSVYPIRNMTISTAWSKSLSNTVSPLLLSNNGSTNYYGLATYQYRKLLFQAGVTKFSQSISSAGALPTMLTAYSFGVSRWFKAF
jgi:hypothetical protein